MLVDEGDGYPDMVGHEITFWEIDVLCMTFLYFVAYFYETILSSSLQAIDTRLATLWVFGGPFGKICDKLNILFIMVGE